MPTFACKPEVPRHNVSPFVYSIAPPHTSAPASAVSLAVLQVPLTPVSRCCSLSELHIVIGESRLMAFNHSTIGSAGIAISVYNDLDLTSFDSFAAVRRRFVEIQPCFQRHQQAPVGNPKVTVVNTIVECVDIGMRIAQVGGI